MLRPWSSTRDYALQRSLPMRLLLFFGQIELEVGRAPSVNPGSQRHRARSLGQLGEIGAQYLGEAFQTMPPVSLDSATKEVEG
jgi:hypothetical protein